MNTLPNWLTLARIVVIPVVVAAFYLPGTIGHWVGLALFLAAGLTDWLDGYLARRQNSVSPLGRFLDPVADKLLVTAALLMLVFFDRAPVIPALIIVCREILVSGLREFLAERNVVMPVIRLAKWKTAAQMAAICFLLVGSAGPVLLPPDITAAAVGAWLLWLAALLSVITGYNYLRFGLRHMLATPGDQPST